MRTQSAYTHEEVTFMLAAGRDYILAKRNFERLNGLNNRGEGVDDKEVSNARLESIRYKKRYERAVPRSIRERLDLR